MPDFDIIDDPDYQRFVASCVKYCSCERDCPCDGVLAGGMCDKMTYGDSDWYEGEEDDDDWF